MKKTSVHQQAFCIWSHATEKTRNPKKNPSSFAGTPYCSSPPTQKLCICFNWGSAQARLRLRYIGPAEEMLSGFELLNFFGLLLWLRSTSMAMHMLSGSCISFIPKQGHKTGQSSSTVRSKALPLWTSAETEAPGLEICSWFSGSSESAGWLGGWSLEWRGIKLNIAVGVGDKMKPELGLTDLGI